MPYTVKCLRNIKLYRLSGDSFVEIRAQIFIAAQELISHGLRHCNILFNHGLKQPCFGALQYLSLPCFGGLQY